MKKDVRRTIIETLRTRGKLSYNELRKSVIAETGSAKSTFNYNLGRMYLKGKLIRRSPPQWDIKKNVYYYLEEQERNQDELQSPRFDFRPDIREWYEQLSYWDEFFTPWVPSKQIVFDGRLRIENEPTYPIFKKYVENMLNKIEKTSDICNPFDEHNKLKIRIKTFNELRDKILDEFKLIIKRRKTEIKSKLSSYNDKTEQSLLQLLYMRKTFEFLKRRNFNKKFSISIENNLDNKIDDKHIISILKLLSNDVNKSKVITEKTMIELWTMISEAQLTCNRIMRMLKILKQIK